MKKILLTFISLLMLSACSTATSSNFSKYFDKKYMQEGQGKNDYYEFHETFFGFGNGYTKYPCVYQSQTLEYDYNHDEFPSLEFNMNKNYVHVFAYGTDTNYPNKYVFFGFFYTDTTFVTVYGRYNNSTVSGVFKSK